MKKSHQLSSPRNGAGQAHKPSVPNPRSIQIGVTVETRQIPVYVVLPPRLLLLDIAGPLEVLRQTNRVQTTVQFLVRYVGPRPSLLTSIGVTLNAIEPLPNQLPPQAWVVLAGDVEQVMMSGGATVNRNTEADETDEAAIVAWLKTAIRPGHKVICICTGALTAARAGLLDGRACTTHHSSCEELAAITPKAKVLENRLYVEDGDRFSSAGITAGIDLMLHLVHRYTDQSCAVAVARYLVVYLRRSGADPQLSPWLEGRNHLHPAVHRAQDAIASDLTKSWTLRGLARVAGASDRHLSRLFHEHVGMTVSEYGNRLRVALAQELLRETDFDMERVAERAGFSSSRQLRRAWGRVFKTPPRESRVRTQLGSPVGAKQKSQHS
ncbi:MAG TPA: helix-turn-helix domain-containing protein [Candidatus Sulfotelmatobacter sp.]|nr:helix-turn-helix domain-containing protein [Candidatus Sulfotelmatobacter sp.]